MKNSILLLAIQIIIVGTILSGCNTPAENVENAKNEVKQANENLREANKEYLADIEKYRKEVAIKIAENDKSMADFKARIETNKKNANIDYKDRIAKIEQKNSDMKKKMDNYKAEIKNKWQDFKYEFTRDMDELSKDLKDLTINIK